MVTNIAHRGASGVAPENTIAAFEIAAMMGADAVEFDVQLSSDGVPVIYHDDSLARHTDVRLKFPDRNSWSLSDFTFDALSALDAGFAFAQKSKNLANGTDPLETRIRHSEKSKWLTSEYMALYASGEVRIPTLAEALACCRELNLHAAVELKSIPHIWPELPDLVVQEIKTQRMEHLSTVSSFDHQHLARVRQLDSDLPIAVLTTDRLHKPEDYLSQLGAQAYNPGCYGAFDTIGLSSKKASLDLPTIHRLLENGFGVNVWTSNDEDEMSVLIEAGVSGIFTDFPNRLSNLLIKNTNQELFD